ncbi:hypothetical protein CC78DRAFT_577486 [Lojkania enalia]|uniref:Ankyrin repeat protein n=1 Tax=Lojkania enalia TaxID=147567 RepID=A0A9P4N8Y9_9PLEO|nr:hypothetical protein CC78DRAFT_577486 [Didymosphaeria enalia]
MDVERRNSSRFNQDLNKRGLKFTPCSCTVFDVALFNDASQTILRKDRKEDTQLQDWIASEPPEFNSQQPSSLLRFIVGNRVNDDPRNALMTIPFTRGTFVAILENCHLPKTVLRTIFKGEAHYSRIIHGTNTANDDWKGCVMRMARDLAGHRDLVIALSWSLPEKITYALLLGCDDQDVKSISTFMTYSSSIGHPLLLLTLFADLQLKRQKQLYRESLKNLQLAFHQARLSRKEGPEVYAVRKVAALEAGQSSIDYDKVTRDVLHNFQSSGYLMQAIIQFRTLLEKVVADVNVKEASLTAERATYWESHSRRIQEQIEAIMGKYDTLIERSRLATNESSLLISAIWNLIAQKDNHINQEIATQSKSIAEESKWLAEGSKAIAEATKRDSTSMAAIATLTMIFLPASYAATLLALPMFNWQAKSGERVFNFHSFRIYLAVAIPLTVSVFSMWLVWLIWSEYRRKREVDTWNKRTCVGSMIVNTN